MKNIRFGSSSRINRSQNTYAISRSSLLFCKIRINTNALVVLGKMSYEPWCRENGRRQVIFSEEHIQLWLMEFYQQLQDSEITMYSKYFFMHKNRWHISVDEKRKAFINVTDFDPKGPEMDKRASNFVHAL